MLPPVPGYVRSTISGAYHFLAKGHISSFVYKLIVAVFFLDIHPFLLSV